MTKISHKFLNHEINQKTEILVIGTFNPNAKDNEADFFYGRSKNYLWKLIPIAYSQMSLKGSSLESKLKFIEERKIDFVDLIKQVDVEDETNYKDSYLDNKVTQWRDLLTVISSLKNLKRICITRKTMSGIPNMKLKIDDIIVYCKSHNIPIHMLPTPARYYSEAKQTEWTKFFNDSIL